MSTTNRLRDWRIGVACLLGALALAACGGAERDDSGAIVEGGDVGVFSLRVGDCFDDPPGVLLPDVTEVDEVDAIPCAESHDNEVYAIGDHPAADDVPYPGDEAIQTFGLGYCLSEFERYVGRAYETSRLDLSFIFPLEDGWERDDDRELVCFLYDLNFAKLTGSMKGTAE